ncbi:Uncharacterised protein r2_g3727 [Pycnogonum litorale]
MDLTLVDSIQNLICLIGGGPNGTEAKAIECLQNFQLLPSTRNCCGTSMTIKRKVGYRGGFCFRCSKCRSNASMTTGTFFDTLKLSYRLTVYLMFLWSERCSVGLAARLIKVPKQSVIQYFGYFREIASEKLMNDRDSFMFGGQGQIVYIDESVVLKRKYNRGRLVSEKWAFGIFDGTFKKGFCQLVSDRSRNTLIPIILSHVRPGSIIYSDQWAAYSNLGNLPGSPYVHKTVNHSRYFVDPQTGACTNAVEAYWSRIKRYLRQINSMGSANLAQHLDTFMWLERYGDLAFQNLLTHIRDHPNYRI